MLLALVLGLSNLIAALAPTSGVDTLIYHLPVVKGFVRAHGIVPLPDILGSDFPLNMEMLYLFGTLLASDVLTQLMHFFFGALALLMVYVMARREYKAEMALMAGVLFYALPDVSASSGQALSDLGTGYFVLGAAYALIRWSQQENSRWAALSGVFAGLAAGTKHSGSLAAFILFILLLAHLFLPWRKRQSLLKGASLYLLFFVALAGPWWAKNWAMAGNPIWPLFPDLFRGGPAGSLSLETMNAIFAAVDRQRTLTSFLTWPWDLTMDPKDFRSSYIGPVYLALLPGLLLTPVRWKGWKLAGLFSFLYLMAWLLVSPVVRYAFAPFALLGILVVAVLNQMQGIVRTLGLGVVALWLTLGLGANIYFHAQPVPAGLGLVGREAYLSTVSARYRFPGTKTSCI